MHDTDAVRSAHESDARTMWKGPPRARPRRGRHRPPWCRGPDTVTTGSRLVERSRFHKRPEPAWRRPRDESDRLEGVRTVRLHERSDHHDTHSNAHTLIHINELGRLKPPRMRAKPTATRAGHTGPRPCPVKEAHGAQKPAPPQSDSTPNRTIRTSYPQAVSVSTK